MIGASVALAFAFVWHARNAEEPFLPLPLLGGTVVPYAMAAGGCALGAITGAHRAPAAVLRGRLSFDRERSGPCADPARGGFTCGAAIAGRTMARAKHYKRVAIAGTSAAAIFGVVLTVTTLPLWGLLIVLSLFALGLGTTFPVSVVSLQNSVARADRHRDGGDEFLSRADVVVHGRRLQRDPADGAGRGHLASANTGDRRMRFPQPT